uniref:Uncharacterized protein n=1 Tax=Micrurus lemniscatus lemniscatus TaxID=129467 RepID=A0A2D4INN0_MICLE
MTIYLPSQLCLPSRWLSVLPKITVGLLGVSCNTIPGADGGYLKLCSALLMPFTVRSSLESCQCVTRKILSANSGFLRSYRMYFSFSFHSFGSQLVCYVRTVCSFQSYKNFFTWKGRACICLHAKEAFPQEDPA